MIRYKLVIEYDGTPFCGLQRQDTATSVQGVLEDAIFKMSGEQVTVFAAGRTDAGVHATNQVVHFDLSTKHGIHKLIRSISYFCKPHPVCVVSAEYAAPDFHARFSAKNRSYIYKILNRTYGSVLLENRVWHLHEPLDVSAMQDATELLIGTNDLTSFRSVHCQSESPIKTIDSLGVSKDGDIISISITAKSFLHNQVRIIAGALKNVGEGRWDKAKLQSVLEAKDRSASAQTAPACGLYFVGVGY